MSHDDDSEDMAKAQEGKPRSGSDLYRANVRKSTISVGDSVHLNIFGIPESGVAGGMNQNVRRRN